mgnify:FL=1
MRFTIETDEQTRVVALEGSAEGVVFVTVQGIVVARFDGDEQAMVIDDSNVQSLGLKTRHVPIVA